MLGWRNYALATELTETSEDVQVATLLTVVEEEAREVYSTFSGWGNDGDQNKIEPVLTNAYRKPASHTNNTERLCKSSLKAAILITLGPKKYCETVWFLEYVTLRSKKDYSGSMV